MASYRRSFRFLALIVILLLIMTACVRPFSQSDEEAAQATAEAEVTAQAEDEAQPAEPADDDADSADADSADTGEMVDEQEEGAPITDEEQEQTDDAASEPGEDQEETVEATGEDAAESGESSSETVDENAAAETDADSSEEAVEEASDEDAVADQDSSMDADSEVAPESDASESDATEPTTTTEPTPLPAVHVVLKGENLFRIGLKYGLSWVPLAYYNHIPNPDLIYVGQNIYIPGGHAPPAQSKPESSSYTNYVVKHGDTLFRISRAFGVSLEEIVEANGIVNPNRIFAGQVLKIPTWTP